MTLRALKLTISFAAVALMVAHLLWPALKVDATTLGLLAVAILPWLQPLVKSAELPGGLKIEFQELKAAAAKVTAKALSVTATGAIEPPQTKSVFEPTTQDPNLTLVALRIEIEKRLRALATKHGVDAQQPLARVTKALQQRDVFDADAAGGLLFLIDAGNQAAHGALVSADAAAWARTYASDVLDVLDARLADQ